MMMLLPTLALWAIAATGAPAASATENPWTGGSEAPPPDELAPPATAPREEGASTDPLDVPVRPPEPVRPPLLTGLLPAAEEQRLQSDREPRALWSRGALDLDTALVGVPGLWLRHEQAGAARLSSRGLDDRHLAVTLDGVPLFDLAGLLPPLEQLSVPGSATLRFRHGARAHTALGGAAAGALEVETGASARDLGDSLRMDGVLGAGYGGPDQEKGVLAAVESGWARARAAAHAALLHREDLRLGRGDPSQAAGSLVERSGGSGGAVGARAEVSPWPGLRLFSAWHSSRAMSAPRPPGCSAENADGRALDCTATLERGLDVWLAGGDAAIPLAGVRLGARARAHLQHGIALDERSGARLTFVERAHDEGVRAGADLTLDAQLPALALWDVVVPRATLSVDAYADRFSSSFARRSVRFRDAEPPGEGLFEPASARRVDDALARHLALGLELRADGARSSAWASGSVALGSLSAPAVPGRLEEPMDAGFVAPSAELGARFRVTSALSLGATVSHLQEGERPAALLLGPAPGATGPLSARPGYGGLVDDALEVTLGWQSPWLEVEVALWGAQRAGLLVEGTDPDDAALGEPARLVPGPLQLARGAEARAALRPGLHGLLASGALGLVDVDEGGLFDPRTPAPGAPNAQGLLEAAWDPPSLPFGVLTRARFLLPQQRLSPTEERDPQLCPERPSDDELAAGVAQAQPCRGAPGAFLFDVGAHLDVGDFRVDALVENLLDQQSTLRDEPLGMGGVAGRVLFTLRL